LTFFDINLTLFNGKNDMCLKNTDLPCAYQIDRFFLCIQICLTN